jgi:hypothetical protein
MAQDTPGRPWHLWVIGIIGGLKSAMGVLSFSSAISFPPKANEFNGFVLMLRNRNELASSNLRRRFRPFAGFCRVFYSNGTRNGTRRGGRA